MAPVRPALAQDDAERALAKQLFAQGVVAGASKDWAVATKLFEDSLRHAEHPATRFNLVLANDELDRSLEVVRHAWAFLDLPATDSRPETRAQVHALLQSATAKLAVLSTEALTPGTELSVDDRPPPLVHAGLIYLAPGAHVLEARARGSDVRRVELSLTAGQTRPWPEPEAAKISVPMLAPPLATARAPETLRADAKAQSTTLRSRAAWGVGGVAVVSGVAAVALYAASKLLGKDIVREGYESKDYPDDAMRYQRLQGAVAPLALSSGVLIAGALMLGPRTSRSKSLPWGMVAVASGALFVGLAGVWLAHESRPLIEGTPVQGAVVQAGCLWLGASLPLLTYGISQLIGRHNRGGLRAQSALPLRVTW